MPSLKATGILILVGIFTQIGQICLTRALQTEAAGRAAAFSYAQVVFASLFGWALFDEVPDLWFVCGAALILSGTLVNMLLKQKPVG
jgi:drug/metabolite transporter (DMT)-like permease